MAESNEQAVVNTIEYNCAVGIVLNLMRNGVISTEEYDAIELKLKKKYGIENGCAG